MFFGAGAQQYPHWLGFDSDWLYDVNVQAPDGWVWRITVRDGNDKEITVEVDHAKVMRAVRKIARHEVDDVSVPAFKNCQLLISPTRWEEADFDSVTADEVLQVATLGKIIYC
jgi:hypothetical protein